MRKRDWVVEAALTVVYVPVVVLGFVFVAILAVVLRIVGPLAKRLRDD